MLTSVAVFTTLLSVVYGDYDKRDDGWFMHVEHILSWGINKIGFATFFPNHAPTLLPLANFFCVCELEMETKRAWKLKFDEWQLVGAQPDAFGSFNSREAFDCTDRRLTMKQLSDGKLS
jgi:hypothetical protein